MMDHRDRDIKDNKIIDDITDDDVIKQLQDFNDEITPNVLKLKKRNEYFKQELDKLEQQDKYKQIMEEKVVSMRNMGDKQYESDYDRLMRGDLEAFATPEMSKDPMDDLAQQNPKKDESASEDIDIALDESRKQYEQMKYELLTRDFSYDDLSDEQLDTASKLSGNLNADDLTQLTNFGTLAQEQLGTFSDELLSSINVGDTQTVETTLIGLMSDLKNTSSTNELLLEKPTFIQKLFKVQDKRINQLTKVHERLGERVNEVVDVLGKEKDTLMEDIHMLNNLYEKNKQYYTAISVFIAAGHMKLDDLVNDEIPKAIERARKTGSSKDIQEVNDIVGYMDRLEKRVYDLKMSRQIIIQQAPQIKVVQSTNQQLAEKINVSLNTAIPLWKNQLVMTMALNRQLNASRAHTSVTDTTNELLIQNANLVHDNTVRIARENERGIVDIETLEATQTKLIETLDTTLHIKQEGRKQRTQAERKLETMNTELKQKILDQVTSSVSEPSNVRYDVTPDDE